MRAVLFVLGSAALFGAAEPLHAQCTGVQQHQFDFVVGNWLVRNASGRAIGTVTVSHQFGGCALIEQWHGMARSAESLGVIGYQPNTGIWHREFIDQDGVLLTFDGHREGDTMVMTGTDYQPDFVRMHRVTWTSRPDGSVEERWQTSTDAGRSWQEHYYGVLRRIAE